MRKANAVLYFLPFPVKFFLMAPAITKERPSRSWSATNRAEDTTVCAPDRETRPKYLPGNPTIVIQNMPAPKHHRANHLYGVAKPTARRSAL